MKKLLTLFFFMISLYSFSQKKDTTKYYYHRYEPTKAELRKCEQKQKKNIALFNQLSEEAKNIDFKKLTSVIINDLNNSDFKGDVILFYVTYSNTVCGNDDEDTFRCVMEHNSINPFYSNRSWTYDDLISLSKVLNKKVIVPSKKNFGFSISNRLFGEDMKEMISGYKEFKTGRVQDKEVNEGSEKFFYLTEKTQEKDLLLQTDYIYNKVLNYSYDTLYFKFKNLPGYKVQVTIIINSNPISKTYEYYSGEWSLVDSE
jgi:hypothetical protein|nr:hypothetical protein [Chryseobacterium sp.]